MQDYMMPYHLLYRSLVILEVEVDSDREREISNYLADQFDDPAKVSIIVSRFVYLRSTVVVAGNGKVPIDLSEPEQAKDDHKSLQA